jgi:hypothetical protein
MTVLELIKSVFLFLDPEFGFDYNNQMPFSTYDRDLDMEIDNCAVSHHGAWWYSMGTFINLNGLYQNDTIAGHYHEGIDFEGLLRTSSMMIRR